MIAEENSAFPMISKKFVETLSTRARYCMMTFLHLNLHEPNVEVTPLHCFNSILGHFSSLIQNIANQTKACWKFKFVAKSGWPCWKIWTVFEGYLRFKPASFHD